MTYINLDGNFIDSNRKKANKDAVRMEGEGTNNLLWEELPKDEVSIEEISDDGVINVVSSSDLGYISIYVRLDDEGMMKLITIAVKRLNKFKAVLEGLK